MGGLRHSRNGRFRGRHARPLDSARLIDLYDGEGSELAERMRGDSRGLQEVLVQAIALSHPDHPFVIEDAAYTACRTFLANFGRLYTLNYDLLLYWALMRGELEPAVSCDDGFRTPDEGEAEYVTWDPDTVGTQDVYYLHGALHLFDAGHELQKYTWINTQIRLIEQVRAAMAQELFPVFVSEGHSTAKLEKIRHSAYLARCERSLYSIGGTLFVYGWSLGANDAHILRAIERSRVRTVFISLFGDPDSDANRALASRADALVEARGGGRPLEVHYYSAESAHVWG